MGRNYKTVECKICGFETQTNGISTHLKSKHGIGVDEYVTKFGEYRPKHINYKSKGLEKYTCKICNERCISERHLTGHLRSVHSVEKIQYVQEYIFNNEIPKCECGCGEPITLIGQFPYSTKFISGHNVYMHVGMRRSIDSKMRMRKSAIERIKNKKGVFFYNGVSKEELNIRKFIEDNYDGRIIYNDTEILNGLELDIYLPELNLAFEINGETFHSDLYKDKRYHLKKTEECNSSGIHLIHIWLSDWYKCEPIIKSIILNKLGKVDTKIYARDTEIKEVDVAEYNKFLQDNHIQGQSVSKIRIGLYHNNELVQIMGFSSLRRATGRVGVAGKYELIRMCSKINTVVVGGSNKLFKYFLNNYNPQYILSYANRDWATGGVYTNMGFNFVKYTSPGYFYVKSKTKYHRYKFQKHLLVKEGYDVDKTEYEIMLDRGFYRIWDTGNMVYEYKTS